jgi:hypothetical protein
MVTPGAAVDDDGGPVTRSSPVRPADPRFHAKSRHTGRSIVLEEFFAVPIPGDTGRRVSADEAGRES